MPQSLVVFTVGIIGVALIILGAYGMLNASLDGFGLEDGPAFADADRVKGRAKTFMAIGVVMLAWLVLR